MVAMCLNLTVKKYYLQEIQDIQIISNELKKNMDLWIFLLYPLILDEPRYFMKFYHMNLKESVRAHKDLQSKLSIGMHFGTFQLTAEKINDPIEQFEIQKKKQSVPDTDFITLEVERSLNFPGKRVSINYLINFSLLLCSINLSENLSLQYNLGG